jgi:hypothetical protein
MTGLQKGMMNAGDMLAQRAEAKAPVDTGRLARSIHSGEPFLVGEMAMGVKVGTNVVYARAHEFGSGIHAEDPAARELILIEAGFWTGKSDKKALSFRWPGHMHMMYGRRAVSVGGVITNERYEMGMTDRWAFRRVYHPGVPAHPYLRPALHETAPQVARLVMGPIRQEMARA